MTESVGASWEFGGCEGQPTIPPLLPPDSEKVFEKYLSRRHHTQLFNTKCFETWQNGKQWKTVVKIEIPGTLKIDVPPPPPTKNSPYLPQLWSTRTIISFPESCMLAGRFTLVISWNCTKNSLIKLMEEKTPLKSLNLISMSLRLFRASAFVKQIFQSWFFKKWNL